MRKTFVFVVLCFCVCSAQADVLKHYLKQLDKAIDNCDEYYAHKERSLDSLKMLLRKAKTYEEKYKQNWALYEEYRPYALDSAAIFLKQAEVLAKEQNDSIHIIKAHLGFTPIFLYSGMYKSAMDLLSDWRQRSLHGPLELRMEYFRMCVDLYSALINNDIGDNNLSRYRSRLRSARDSIIKYMPDTWTYKADQLAFVNKDYRKALEIYHQHIKDTDRQKESALMFFCIAQLYQKLGDKANQMKYLTLSAISDIQWGVREYRSLNDLALMLYQDGDLEHAFKYIRKAIEDANNSKSGLRSIKSSKILQIIAEAHEKQEHRIQFMYTILLLAAALFIVLLVVGLALLRRKNKQLNTMHAMLQQSLIQQEELSNTRSKYIHHFIDLCQGYLTKMEGHRKEMFKIAGKRNFDELYNAVKSSRFIDEEIDTFYKLFDEAFLNIYPDFVENVNQLLRSEERIKLNEGEALNTELRMLILIKYGITDNSELAKFLRCSHSTVYNYKTKIRNRAINRDTFDKDVMKI